MPLHDTSSEEIDFVYANFFNTLGARPLLKYVDIELAINRYSDVVDESRSPPVFRSKSAMARISPQDVEGKRRLLRALDLIDLAVAQQAWLGGDVLLPELADLVSKPFDQAATNMDFHKTQQEPDTTQKNSANRAALAHLAVANSSLLLQNVTRYRLYSRMREAKYNSFTYAWAQAMKNDPYYLNEIAGPGYDIKWESEPRNPVTKRKMVAGWYVTYKYQDAIKGGGEQVELVPFPDPQDVRYESFSLSDELVLLLNERERIKGQLLNYDIVERATDEKKTDSLKRIALNANVNRRRYANHNAGH